MKRILNPAILTVAVLVLSSLAAHNAAAIELTLSLVKSQSNITLTGDFGTIPFSPQDVDVPPPASVPPPGTTDYDPAHPSNYTTFQGTIKVDVNNVNSPTSIQILSSVADADLSGKWLPEVQPFLDRNGDLSFGDFGAPPGGDSCPATGAQPADCTPGDGTAAPPTDADWGVRNVHPGFGVDLALASARDIVYNITSPVEAVAAGQFSSLNENFEFATGWLDYWVSSLAGNVRGRAELAGGDDDNLSVLPSSYTVTVLPLSKREIKLTIPIRVGLPDPDADANFYYDGQFVATLVVPEPATFVLSGMAMAFAAAFGARRRK